MYFSAKGLFKTGLYREEDFTNISADVFFKLIVFLDQ